LNYNIERQILQLCVCVYVYVCCENFRALLEADNERRSNVGNVYGNT